MYNLPELFGSPGRFVYTTLFLSDPVPVINIIMIMIIITSIATCMYVTYIFFTKTTQTCHEECTLHETVTFIEP